VAETLSPAGLEEYFEKLAPILAAPPGGGVLPARRGLRDHDRDDWIEELERTYGVKL
jgi:hypothetical protein